MCEGCGLKVLLGAANLWMLSFAERLSALLPLTPLAVPFGTADGAILVGFSCFEVFRSVWPSRTASRCGQLQASGVVSMRMASFGVSDVVESFSDHFAGQVLLG